MPVEDVSDIGGDKILPPKLETIARAIRKNFDALKRGERVRFARKKVKEALDCREFVSDDEIIGIFSDKMTILEREQIFDGMSFNWGLERDVETIDGDRIIFLELWKPLKDRELEILSNANTRPRDNKESPENLDNANVAGHQVKNERFMQNLREQEERRKKEEEERIKQEEERRKQQESENKTESEGDDSKKDEGN